MNTDNDTQKEVFHLLSSVEINFDFDIIYDESVKVEEYLFSHGIEFECQDICEIPRDKFRTSRAFELVATRYCD
jgi:hypothetical protein